MEKRGVRVFTRLLYFVCAASLLVFLYLDFFGFALSKYAKFATVAVVFLSAYFASYIRCKNTRPETARTIMYNTFFFLFTVYIVIIADFTLIDGAFGRNVSALFSKSPEERRFFLQNGVNLIPLATVKLFINGYKNGVLSFGDIIINIIGNFLVFGPLAFFVPVYIKRIDRLWKFALAVSVLIIVIEALQVLLMAGAADIDDLLINLSGACVFYGVLRIRPVSRALGAVTFGVWEEVLR